MTRIVHQSSLVWLTIALLSAPRLSAADDPKPDEKKTEPAAVFELVVDPAPEPVPALRYHLLPPPEKLLPGNAAPIYLRLIHEQSEQWKQRLGKEPGDLLELPADKFPLDDVRKLLDSYADASDQISAAARRADCDWSYVLEDRDPLLIMLPDAQFMRNYGRLLGVQLRYQAMTGDLPAAIGTLGDGLAMGQHAARAPFLVNRLIGIAIDDILFEQVDLVVSQPGAPNLYWGFAALPRPLISLASALSTEGRLLEMRFPELDDLDRPRTTVDWKGLAADMRGWATLTAKMETNPPKEDELVERIARPASPEQMKQARAYLRGQLGFFADRTAAMSEAEVEVRYTRALYHEISDGWQKWYYIPYPQSLPRIGPSNAAMRAEAERRELYPLVSVVTPPKATVLVYQARTDRHVARQQAIEALRMHAAATGKLPQTLDEVTVVPVPLDPATGAAFSYQLEGDAAILDVAELAGMERQQLRFPVRIRLRGK